MARPKSKPTVDCQSSFNLDSDEHLRQFLDVLPDAVIISRDGMIVAINKQIEFTRQKGISLSEWDSIDHLKGNDEDKKVFESIDKNHKKRITFPEFSSYSDTNSNIDDDFNMLDKEKNGSLSRDEISIPPLFMIINISVGRK